MELETLKEKLSSEEFEGLTKLIQSETDKVRTKYSSEKKEIEEELKKYKPKEKTDAEKTLEEKIKALEEKQKELDKKELKFKLQETLEENNLPKQLADYINGGDDLETISKEIGEILNQHIVKSGFKPKTHKNTETKISKEDFKKLGYFERQKIYNENPDLYKALIKE